MLTTGSKYLFGSAALALLGAFFFALATANSSIGMSELTGAITLGYKGGVGNHFAYTVLVAYAGAAIFVGAVFTAVRDGDPEAGAQLIGLDSPPPTAAPQGASHWPIIGAFGAGMVALGTVFNELLFIAGLVLLGVVALEWTINAWASRATGDPVVNRKVRNRLVNPFEIPLMAIAGIALFVLAISRLLLSVDSNQGLIIFGAVPTVAFIVAIVLNSRHKVSKSVIAGLLMAGAVLVLGAGVVGLVQGSHPVEDKPHSDPQFQLKGQAVNNPAAPKIVKEGE